MKILNFLTIILDFFFPIPCFHCERFDIFSRKLGVCKQCLKVNHFLGKTEPNRCDTCSGNVENGSCLFCNSRNIFFKKLIYLRERNDFEKNLIRKIKFGQKPYLSLIFRINLRQKLKEFKTIKFSSLTQIPSNKSTLRDRPIHPCRPITKFITANLNLKQEDITIKNSNELQSGKNYRDRFLHARNAFVIRDSFKNKLSGNYLLIDDVFTTGATINETARLLLENGAENVYVLVLLKGK